MATGPALNELFRNTPTDMLHTKLRKLLVDKNIHWARAFAEKKRDGAMGGGSETPEWKVSLDPTAWEAPATEAPVDGATSVSLVDKGQGSRLARQASPCTSSGGGCSG